jgi:hypothetical protein
MRDVARRAGVSTKTVSNVINGYAHITPSTRERVERAIAEQHHRGVVRTGGQVLGGERERAEEQPVDELVAEPRRDEAFALAQALGLVDQHRPAALGGGGDDEAGQFGEVRAVELGQR